MVIDLTLTSEESDDTKGGIFPVYLSVASETDKGHQLIQQGIPIAPTDPTRHTDYYIACA